MTFTDTVCEEMAIPGTWQYKGSVDYKGESFPFWFEYDSRTDQFEYSLDGEPAAGFDYEAFQDHCISQVESKVLAATS